MIGGDEDGNFLRGSTDNILMVLLYYVIVC